MINSSARSGHNEINLSMLDWIEEAGNRRIKSKAVSSGSAILKKLEVADEGLDLVECDWRMERKGKE